MPIPVTLSVSNPAELLETGLYGAGAIIRVQSATAAAGSYSDLSGTGSEPTTAIVAGTYTYTANDPNGTFSTWYRARYENAGGTRVSVDWAGDAAWASRPGHAPFQLVSLHPDYATLADMRAFMRVTDGSDTLDDARASLAITAASRAVEQACSNRRMKRQFGLNGSAVPRYYTPKWNPRTGRWWVEIDDLMTTVGLIVKADLDWDGTYETTLTDFQLRPRNAAGDLMAWTSILFGITIVGFTALTTSSVGPSLEGILEVTANWGWTQPFPDTIKNATLLQALRFYKRRDSPYGIAGSPEMGNELRLLARVDPDVAIMLVPYGR